MIGLPEIEGALMLFVVGLFLFMLVTNASDTGKDAYPERELVAELGDLNVVIVTDKAARVDLVKLTFGPGGLSENGLITSAQARELAEWLRIAASPGKTLAEAKYNRRHGGHSSLPG